MNETEIGMNMFAILSLMMIPLQIEVSIVFFIFSLWCSYYFIKLGDLK